VASRSALRDDFPRAGEQVVTRECEDAADDDDARVGDSWRSRSLPRDCGRHRDVCGSLRLVALCEGDKVRRIMDVESGGSQVSAERRNVARSLRLIFDAAGLSWGTPQALWRSVAAL